MRRYTAMEIRAPPDPSQLARNNGFARQLYLLCGLESPFQVQYTLNGKSGKAALDGLLAARMQTPGGRGVTKFTLLDGNLAGVLKIAGFRGQSDTGKPLREFFLDVFTTLHEKNIPNLIINVRNTAARMTWVSLDHRRPRRWPSNHSIRIREWSLTSSGSASHAAREGITSS